MPEVKIGDYVALAVSSVDQGLSDAPNVICRIVDIDHEYAMHELACEAGVFSTKYARNAFTLLTGDLELNIKMDVKLGSIREATRLLSV
jgi:hypothetical protein